MTDLKVVQLKPEGYSDPIKALKSAIEMMESGEIEPCETGALVLMGKNGAIETYGFGPKSDDLQVLGLLRLGEQVIIDGSFPKGG
ncbi:MAG TPA: hypothetical protein DEP32_14285 [Pseudomonas sp.]|nr:hypothetical protein [Pseudomonas sp.]MBB50183.1 hypothetical protein [Pseudomonadales bacterium]MBB50569.1 hypothetical protein [Pseudomonadales bacterium]MBO08873.1 hypothetical protein [Acidobacteriota bacterium]HCA25328.1 hypothetical protein [Pseudomonas sp.]|tara:strand:- start:28331 stop:28585 length:255 start_codon:yes stop_codon:yes gene_type:complete